ncbi:O-methyltransferase [Aspergillus sclerotioniger CBS 115572]|uniref:O-methyltransferase n=1 Tax=Aspergillus sclerotioniger CBS 115572 TaxID=1450535 RepID=A0A317XEP8_9EURO|nr:O-methyltransferase [Aspergillus sclerotioniger CBS 115572]PWY95090.1 O-methyltransferase [Aspergillus sclerotioniger CBS 115572]
MGDTGHKVEAVQQSLDQLISAAKKSQENLSVEDRYSLMIKATRLVQTLRGPADALFAHLENAVHMGAIRTLLEAGVFHAIPTGGKSISAAEISEKTGVDKELIVRYMRAVTPIGPFQETGEEQYAHTPFSEIYLAPQMRAVYNLTVDEYAPPMFQSHEFFRQKNWKHEISPRSNQYTFAHDCEGKTMFEHVAQFPDRLSRLSDAMTASDSNLPTVGIYPIAEELGPLASDDTVTLVDVGGGRGHVIRQIKESAPDLKGRFILQDEAHVIQNNGDENEKYGIEAMAHDFFQPQPVKGALAYYLRRCLHDWPNEPEAQKILSNLAAAMDREKSRVLITECVVPEVGATMFHAWMDQAVMTIGGRERTEKDWAHLLDISGLRLVKVWRTPEMSVGVVEARLK